ncbi:MAG: pantetheine-phosphate adenylyltransferase [Deltaproteobacteria bacterium]|nr:pantetheine-phosphate adenylyltransferase [Deltaproteobacteria bacterium]
MTRIAVYPGTFDPLTLGHVDIIRRALTLFDRLIVAVAHNERKQPWFSLQERMDMVRTSVDSPGLVVDTIEGLLVDYTKAQGAIAIIRGLRNGEDLAYESNMTLMNRRLAPSIDTVFLLSDPAHMFVSSSLVKEVASFGGAVDEFLSPAVAASLRDRVALRRQPTK